MMSSTTPLGFAPAATQPFAERLVAALGVPLAPMEEREFEGGEHKTRPLVEPPRSRGVVVPCLSGDESGSANDRLCRLLFFIAGLKDCGARRVTACLPFLCYARKDRGTKERDPVTLRYVAQLLEAVGTDHVLALDAHNLAAFENAFRCPVDGLEAAPLMARHSRRRSEQVTVTIVSPDFGGAKRAQRLQDLLAVHAQRDIGFALHEKRRSSGVVSGDLLIGPVEGCHVVIFDDLISAGSTILRARCRRAARLGPGVWTPVRRTASSARGPSPAGP